MQLSQLRLDINLIRQQDNKWSDRYLRLSQHVIRRSAQAAAGELMITAEEDRLTWSLFNHLITVFLVFIQIFLVIFMLYYF